MPWAYHETMPEQSTHSPLSFLLADAERAMDGLAQSLSRPLEDMPQAALHVFDLVTVLSRLGFDSDAQELHSLGQELLMGQPTALATLREQLIVTQHRLLDIQALPSHPTPTSPPSSAAPSALDTDQPRPTPTAAWGGFGWASTSMTQWAAQGTLTQDRSAISPIRQRGLGLLQHARMLNQANSADAQRALDAILGELQECLGHLDQVPLRNLYNQAQHHVDDVWVDQDVIRGLQRLQPMALRCAQLRVQGRGHRVCIDWEGLQLSAQDLELASTVLAQLSGCLLMRPDGYRLVLPCSPLRMNCLSFMLGGRRYAASLAQCQTDLVALSQDQGAQCHLRVGQHSLTLQVDAWLGCKTMTLYAIPTGIQAPAGVHRVAVDDHGKVHLWFDHAT